MKVYKIIFAKNEILSCDVFDKQVHIDGTYEYQQIHGMLIYALVKANTEEEARLVGEVIIRQVKEEIFGSDYISYEK